MFNWQKFIIRFLKFIFPLGLIVLVGWLIYNDVDVDGQRVIMHAAANPSLLVRGPEPDTRVTKVTSTPGDKFWSIAVDPVYWQLTLPRAYDTIKVDITFQAPGVPLVQFGGLTDDKKWVFEWQGLQNESLEKIEWPCLVDQERDWWLCQKNKNYQSIQNFLLSPPASGRILKYNFTLPESFDYLPVEGFNSQTDYTKSDYLIATFKAPREKQGWLEQSVEFNTTDLVNNDNVIEFTLSAPGINTRHQIVNVKQIVFTLSKEAITWKNFVPKTLSAFKSLFSRK